MRDRSKATITDVADKAGVSIKTVSRVINREANVREKTRAKVLEAAAALDYQPNPSARGLAGSKSFSIGMLYSNPAEFGYVKDNLFGAFQACRDMGYSLLLHPCDETPDVQDVQRFVHQTGIDGLILAAPICDDTNLQAMLQQQGLPFVQIAPTQTARGAGSVQCDDYQACYELTQYLLELGHERIAFIRGDPKHASSERRYEGFRDAMKQAGQTIPRQWVRQGYYDFESGSKCAEKLLQLNPRPSAIVASNDDMAAGALMTAHQQGLDIPAELSVTGFDDTPTARHSWPPLTTVHQPIVDMSYAAAEILISNIAQPAQQVREKGFACRLIVRESTAASRSA